MEQHLGYCSLDILWYILEEYYGKIQKYEAKLDSKILLYKKHNSQLVEGNTELDKATSTQSGRLLTMDK